MHIKTSFVVRKYRHRLLNQTGAHDTHYKELKIVERYTRRFLLYCVVSLRKHLISCLKIQQKVIFTVTTVYLHNIDR